MARSTLEDFVIKRTIGSGSYGVVYKVIRKLDKETYAMKEIDLKGLSRQEQENCVRETRVLACLKSDYIVKYYDSFFLEDKLYIITEYASGGNLFHFLQQTSQKLPESLVWRLVIQMLLGLHHMHSMKILHRDFKSMNVFLDKKLNVKLGDMGVAKFLSTNTLWAKTMVGTPYYMSPELCEDKPYNEKSDVWALGIVAYECCTKKHPFDADNPAALILKIVRGKYAPIQSYPAALTGMIYKCLERDPESRPDVHQLLQDPYLQRMAEELGLNLPDDLVRSKQDQSQTTDLDARRVGPTRTSPIKRATPTQSAPTALAPSSSSSAAAAAPPSSAASAAVPRASTAAAVPPTPAAAVPTRPAAAVPTQAAAAALAIGQVQGKRSSSAVGASGDAPAVGTAAVPSGMRNAQATPAAVPSGTRNAPAAAAVAAISAVVPSGVRNVPATTAAAVAVTRPRPTATRGSQGVIRVIGEMNQPPTSAALQPEDPQPSISYQPTASGDEPWSKVPYCSSPRTSDFVPSGAALDGRGAPPPFVFGRRPGPHKEARQVYISVSGIESTSGETEHELGDSGPVDPLWWLGERKDGATETGTAEEHQEEGSWDPDEKDPYPPDYAEDVQRDK